MVRDISMEKISLVTGCYDIVHIGHIELFKFCKSISDKVVVGLDSDERVKESKGKDRPYNNVNDRLKFLEAILYIDDIFVFSSDEDLIQNLHLYSPTYRVLGGDYKDGKKTIVGGGIAQKTVFFDRVGDFSTTNILKSYM